MGNWMDGGSWTSMPGQIRVPGAGGTGWLQDTNPAIHRRYYRIEVELP